MPPIGFAWPKKFLDYGPDSCSSTNLFIVGFLGPVSRVAIILTKELQREKKDTEVKRLDKEYLRSVLTEKDAMARSRRSDEVLVYRGTGCAKLLEINLENPGERILAPGFEGIDRDKFPLEIEKLPRALTAIGGSNKRMFRVDIGGNKFIALLPRPNYCLEKKVLFGDELVKLAKHQFSILCCYRFSGAPVPPAALYIFQLSTSIPKRTYASACILMEDLTMEGLQVDEVNFTKINFCL